MSLIYVSGVSGMGKSEVLKELRTQGLKAYGVDEDSFGDWVNRKTGEVEALTPETASDIHGWFRSHAWVLSKARISRLAAKAKDEGQTIFLCGSADGFDDCKHLFDQVIALHMDDPDILASRIRQRTDIDFGKDPLEMKRILEWQRNGRAHFTSMGAQILDANRPVTEVADDIIKLSAT